MITLKMHVMSVNCTNSPLQNIFPWRNHSTGIGAGGGNTLELRSISLQKYVLTKKKKKAVCVHVCVPCPALPSCLPPDLICIYELLENHVFVLRAKTVTTVLMSFFPFSSHWAGKKERKAEKNVEKRKQEGREWWKREGKASLMFPAKIFRLLPHDASPCPTDTRTLTHSHIYTQSKSRS